MKLVALIAVAVLAGCSGTVSITKPDPPQWTENSKLVDGPRDAVWNAAIPALGKQFFVINTLDKSSGLVNLSYTGDPTQVIDCGQYSSTLDDPQGLRTYKFQGASARQEYDIRYYHVTAEVNLEGRTNVVFEDAGPNRTRVTASTRYVVTRHQRLRFGDPKYEPLDRTDTISFDTGGQSTFPASYDGQAMDCAARGTLEHDILTAIK